LILIVTLFLLPRGRDVSDVLRRVKPDSRGGTRESAVVEAPAEAGREQAGAPASVVPTGGRNGFGNEPRRS
jgi:hypothetical protein